MQLFNMLMGLGFVGTSAYVPIGVISTFYSYSWDLYMDWGLLRSKEKGK
jgi:hypothetical protein